MRSLSDLKFRPSAADTWLRCEAQPVALRECKDLHLVAEEDVGTEASLAGVAMHAYTAGELGQMLGLEIPTAPLPVVVQPSELERLQQTYLDPVTELMLTHAPTLFGVETDVTLWYSQRHGFVDFWWYNDATRVLHIWDLKWGVGVRVEPDSYQLRVYAVALIDTVPGLAWDMIDTVNLMIVQPRQLLQPIRSMRFSVTEIVAFKARIDLHVANVLDEGRPLEYTPSEKACQWCQVKPWCPALTGAAEIAADQLHKGALNLQEFVAGSPLPSVDVLKQGAAILGIVELWCDAMHDACLEQLARDPDALPGWKRVIGRQGNRAWTDDGEVTAKLESLKVPLKEYTETKLQSPTRLEKSLQAKPKVWAVVKGFIFRSPGKPKLVTASDPREAIGKRQGATEVFDVIEENGDEDPFAA